VLGRPIAKLLVFLYFIGSSLGFCNFTSVQLLFSVRRQNFSSELQSVCNLEDNTGDENDNTNGDCQAGMDWDSVKYCQNPLSPYSQCLQGAQPNQYTGY
jgi:hypothetical protein